MIAKVKWFALLVTIESLINLVCYILMIVFKYDYVPLVIAGLYLLGLWISLPKKTIVWTENHWLFEIQTLLSLAMLIYWAINKNILWLLLAILILINTVAWVVLFFKHSKHRLLPIKELLVNPDFYVAMINTIAMVTITVFDIEFSSSSNSLKHISFNIINLIFMFEVWWKRELLYDKKIVINDAENSDIKSIS